MRVAIEEDGALIRRMKVSYELAHAQVVALRDLGRGLREGLGRDDIHGVGLQLPHERRGRDAAIRDDGDGARARRGPADAAQRGNGHADLL